jgi:hypothetical protein
MVVVHAKAKVNVPHPSASQYPCTVNLCGAHRQVIQVECLHCDILICVFGFHVETYTMNTENLVWSILKTEENINIRQGKRDQDEENGDVCQ